MVRKLASVGSMLGFSFVLATNAFGQANFGVSLYSNISLATFGSGGGNDCWGYTAPSGREYAVMGLNNKLAFVEVTNPAAPVIRATIPHSASTWGAIKVYGTYVYAGTETSGTGIQVIDISQIDSGIVTLVRTIASPGRTHTLALNAQTGYLYTCGSREGTGWSMCFSLADPSNPVRVGANSMTTDYNHECQVVSYNSGPYAGKEIWFGFSEGRGVDIYDVTNKNAPVLIKRVTYPNMGYCHQGWLSADKKFLYVDDEFDENNLSVNTRSLIFNVEDLANASYVTSFTSGLPSIDHNQYVTDGFAFQANYTTGLRVFDTTQNPAAPIQTGGFDTYLANNNPTYNGAWSNYPFFPSGTVIISDINGGMFVLNTTEATTRANQASSFALGFSCSAQGTLSSVAASDDDRMILSSVQNDVFVKNPLLAEFSTTAYDTSPTKIRIVVESAFKDGISRGGTNATQNVELYDWTTSTYVSASQTTSTSVDQSIEVTAPGGVQRFVNQTTREVKARIYWVGAKSKTSAGKALIDQFLFRITR